MLKQGKVYTHISKLFSVYKKAPQRLSGAQMATVPLIDDAFLVVNEQGIIADFGQMADFDAYPYADYQTESLKGASVFPAFIDSHTHLVFAGSRELEFVMKLQGQSYEAIAAAGGGILNSANRLRQASDEELLEAALKRMFQIKSLGTGIVEIKSGYGLTLKDELRMLRIAKALGPLAGMVVKTTLLGAHTFPKDMSREAWIKTIIQELIPQAASEGLADFVDVFCEKGYYTPQETEAILEAGMQNGLKPKIHANQLAVSGGVQVGVKMKALSVDHLEQITEVEIACLQQSETLPVVLPGCSFFLRIPYAPARKLIDANLALVIASDFNPGSSTSGSMPFMMELACLYQGLSPEEAFNAVTINAAAALGIEEEYGCIAKGKKANLAIMNHLPNLAYLPYMGTMHSGIRVESHLD